MLFSPTSMIGGRLGWRVIDNNWRFSCGLGRSSISALRLSCETLVMIAADEQSTYQTCSTSAVVHPYPVKTVVGIEKLASVFVETAAATHVGLGTTRARVLAAESAR